LGGGLFGVLALVGVAQIFDFGDLDNPRINDFLGISAPFCLWVAAALGQGLYLWVRLKNWEMMGSWLELTAGAMMVWVVGWAWHRFCPGYGGDVTELVGI
jgi:hypothetical protein